MAIDTGDRAAVERLRLAAYALLRREPDHREAHLRLYELEQILGAPAAAVGHLRAAVRANALVATEAAPTAATHVLALSRIAPWSANVPLELVVDPARIALTRLYMDGTEALDDVLAQIPPHDVLINTIAEADAAQPALSLASRIATALGRRLFNRPDVVAGLGRSAVAQRFAGSATVLAPPVERVAATKLAATLAEHAVDAPLVVRPIDSQAGIDLARIEDIGGLRDYLARTGAAAYYVMPFIDYRRPDGFFRKYRVMFVDGAPYACHLAISPRWMVHYYNAPMAEHAWMRDEEAAFLGDLAHVFDGPRADALREIAAAIPLEYFGIDCAIVPDGRVLLFEADAAMLVHGSDPRDLYPYKQAAFGRIRAALTAVLERAR
jgi:hypothetical protein